jgi:hypothetical protein
MEDLIFLRGQKQTEWSSAIVILGRKRRSEFLDTVKEPFVGVCDWACISRSQEREGKRLWSAGSRGTKPPV